MSVAFTSLAKAGVATEPGEAEGFSRSGEISGLPLVWPYLAGGEPPPLVLRRSGGKPLRLQAEILAEGSSRRAGTGGVHHQAWHEPWHETAIYRTHDGAWAVALRFLSAAGMEGGVHRARLFATEDEAASWLENFDPACDLDADFDVSDPSLSVAQVALKAAALRDHAERIARAYRVMIGELLYRLETER